MVRGDRVRSLVRWRMLERRVGQWDRCREGVVSTERRLLDWWGPIGVEGVVSW